MNKKTLLALVITSTLSGCSLMGGASAPEGICHSSTAVNIPESSVKMKTSESKKAIVLPVDVAAGIDYPQAMGNAFRTRLEAQVNDSGAKLVDRSLANKLKKEIKLAEQSGRYNTSGVPIADYAVISEVNSVNLKYSFDDEETKVNDEGEKKYYPASCTFTGQVDGLIKVVALPSMEVVKRIELSDTEMSRFEQDRPDSDCPISNGQYKRIIENAAKNAVNRSDDLKNVFAPSGLVQELRVCEEYGPMIRVSMGKNLNIKPEQDVEISSGEHIELDDGTKEVELYLVGKGAVSAEENRHGIKPSYSWVGIDEKDIAKIQRGDLVEARYESNCNKVIEPLRTICWDAVETFTK